MSPLALTDVLATLPGPRRRHGRIHPLLVVLNLVVLGLLLARKVWRPSPAWAASTVPLWPLWPRPLAVRTL